MMFIVEKSFKDKETKKLHEKGTLYETDKENRAEELKQGGFLGSEVFIGIDLAVKEDETVKEEMPREHEPSVEDEIPVKPKGSKKGSK